MGNEVMGREVMGGWGSEVILRGVECKGEVGMQNKLSYCCSVVFLKRT